MFVFEGWFVFYFFLYVIFEGLRLLVLSIIFKEMILFIEIFCFLKVRLVIFDFLNLIYIKILFFEGF